jgi:large subunit ribosomal protein L15
MYAKLLVAGQSVSPGTTPASMLSDETKWLAITHKSFDQGKRGFNERLSLLGKRLVESETSMALVANAVTSGSKAEPDEFGRVPFQHPQLNGVETLVETTVESKLSKFALYALANKYGIPAVLRWKPKLVSLISVTESS